MIVLFTDFGLSGPYTGQMKAVLAAQAPGVAVIDLFADAPAFDAQLSAYLLAAYAGGFPAGTVFLCVVDPGVGTARRPLVAEAGGHAFVGPDNGLFELVLRRGAGARVRTIDWRPERMSDTFHGRDLFAPVAARLATGGAVESTPLPLAAVAKPEWPDELPRIVYVDVYGNAMTGIRAGCLPASAVLRVGAVEVRHARTFGAVPEGSAFWYGNSNGLVEIAVNRGRADRLAGVSVGAEVLVG